MSNQLTPKKGSSHVTTTDKRGEKTSERSKTTTNVRRITLVINFLFPCFPLRLMSNRSTASENVDRVSAQPTSLRYSHRSSWEELAPTWNGPTRRHHERPKHTQQTGYLIKSNKKKKIRNKSWKGRMLHLWKSGRSFRRDRFCASSFYRARPLRDLGRNLGRRSKRVDRDNEHPMHNKKKNYVAPLRRVLSSNGIKIFTHNTTPDAASMVRP